jgi:hypothetical protein
MAKLTIQCSLRRIAEYRVIESVKRSRMLQGGVERPCLPALASASCAQNRARQCAPRPILASCLYYGFN